MAMLDKEMTVGDKHYKLTRGAHEEIELILSRFTSVDADRAVAGPATPAKLPGWVGFLTEKQVEAAKKKEEKASQ